ncbi:MAG: caspase family protein [Mesorhizobium sp.]|uniref:caspase family protein n=1 Tax=Mesorhizobium sp. TaxID=1871066 RepID=UPI001AD23B86|nr:caspase family protein [Mesorhizobium sp.]MBN9217599.1 caspase family protein [Mesorhizobium sp.]
MSKTYAETAKKLGRSAVEGIGRARAKERIACSVDGKCIRQVLEGEVEDLRSLSATNDNLVPEWCDKAKSPAELAICGDESLRRKEINLTGMFSTLNSVTLRKAELQQLQRNWLRTRNLCGNDIACLSDSYGRQIELYSGMSAELDIANTHQAGNTAVSQPVAGTSPSGAITLSGLELSFPNDIITGNSIDALFVANDDYLDVAKLKTPAADAALVGAALKSRGIASTTIMDVTQTSLASAIGSYKTSPRKDVFIFYYAGHAATVNGNAALLFPSFSLSSPASSNDYQPISQIIAAISKLGYRKVLVVFDACRTIVDVKQAVASAGDAKPVLDDVSVRSVRPLSPAQVDTDPSGGGEYTIAFSASSGQPAIDTLNGKNSPFAEIFAANIREKPTILSALIDTRNGVSSATGGKQLPRLELGWGADVALTAHVVSSASLQLELPAYLLRKTPEIQWRKSQWQGGEPTLSARHSVQPGDACDIMKPAPNGAVTVSTADFDCMLSLYDWRASVDSIDRPKIDWNAGNLIDGVVQSCGQARFDFDLDADGKPETIGLSNDRYGGSLSFVHGNHTANWYSTLGCNFKTITLYDIDRNGVRDMIVEYDCQIGNEQKSCLLVLSGERLVANVDGTFWYGDENAEKQKLAKFGAPELRGILRGAEPITLFFEADISSSYGIEGNKIVFYSPGGMPNNELIFNRDGSVDSH